MTPFAWARRLTKQFWLSAVNNEQARFILVGGWNTFFGYGCFVLCHNLLGAHWSSFWTLVLSYCVAVPHSFLTQKFLVFRRRGNWKLEFARFILANSAIFVSNLVLLPALVLLTAGDARLIQAILLVVFTIATYLAHKYYSFSREQ